MKELLANVRNRFFGANRLESLIEKHLDDMHLKIERIETIIADLQKHELSRLNELSHLQSIKTLENEVHHLQELSLNIRDQQLMHAKELRNFTTDYLPKKTYESLDVEFMSTIAASLSSAKFFNENLYDKKMLDSDLGLLKWSAGFIEASDLVLEFGVYSGRTINAIAEYLPHHRIYGFDSFDGLPETWRSNFPKGAFQTDNMPEVRDNVILIKGWFDKSLPHFLNEHTGEIGLLHIDCDLYSSTKTIFDLLHDRIKNGAIIIFDEFFNYPGWEQHEYKAFQEFVSIHGFSYEYLAANPRHQQVAVKVWRQEPLNVAGQG